jgi:protein-tyrosine kinase
MEKIKVALAKAKQQRFEMKKSSQSFANQHVLEKKTVEQFPNTESELDKIVYRETAVVKLDPKHLEKNRIISYSKEDGNSAVFDSLRTQVLKKMTENNWRTLAVVSPTPESGKSVVSINLAISIAKQPQKTVVLADFDLRRPKVSTYLGLKPKKSLNEYLQGKAELKDIMINPGIPRLIVLPTLHSVEKSSEMLSSKRVLNCIEELSERYDSRIIIFDSPPVLNSDDAIVLFQHVDAVLLVIANGMSTQAEIEETMHHLPKEKLLGLVMNKAEIEAKQYYY